MMVLSPYRKIAIAVSGLLLLGACCGSEQGDPLEIRLVLDAVRGTRASEGLIDEDAISSWYVLIYNSSGVLLKEMMNLHELSYSLIVDGSTFSDVTVYAFANLDTQTLTQGWGSEEALLSNTYGLSLVQNSGLLPMCCKMKTSFSTSSTLNLKLERMVSKIRLRSVSVDLKGSFSNDTFTQGKVYLQNVVAEMSLEQYFSRSSSLEASESHYPWFYHANWMYSEFDSSSYQGDRQEEDPLGLLGGGGTVFYTLPNFRVAVPDDNPDWADLCTKLVMESKHYMRELGVWLDLYYPVEILNPASGCLEANNVYDLDLIVYCPGYLNPWGPRDTSDPQVAVSIVVDLWSTNTIVEKI